MYPTRSRTQFYVVIVCTIVFLDVAGSVASRVMHFDYTNLVWVSWGAYASTGYLGFSFGRLVGGAVAGLVAGMADGTIGWLLSTIIKPQVPSTHHELTVLSVCLVIATVALLGAFLGFLGALVRLPFESREKSAGA